MGEAPAPPTAGVVADTDQRPLADRAKASSGSNDRRASQKRNQAAARRTRSAQAVLSRFLRGERGINLDTAEKLCRALGLGLRPAKE